MMAPSPQKLSPLARRALAGSLMLALLVAAGGCAKRSKAPDVARFDQESIVAARAVINVLDHDLRNRVGAEIADAQRLEDGRLRIRVNLRNATRKDLNILVRTVFKDSKGLSVGDETEWNFLYLGPQQIQTYTAVSRLPDLGTYTVEVRRP